MIKHIALVPNMTGFMPRCAKSRIVHLGKKSSINIPNMVFVHDFSIRKRKQGEQQQIYLPGNGSITVIVIQWIINGFMVLHLGLLNCIYFVTPHL